MIPINLYASIANYYLMNIHVYDACALIYLTKIKVKEKLPLLGSVIVSPTVKNELIADINRFSDAILLKHNIDIKIIEETKVKLNDGIFSKNLGKGENETILISIRNEGIPVTDDHQAINYAVNCGLKPKTSELILLDLLKDNIISHKEFQTFFNELAHIKSLKPDIVLFFKKKAEEIIKK